ncbi:Ceramidase [Nitrosomonas eutropha]|uniref:Ceramidase n=1 Tax=Nitrosomonas eutropha TaxID=916 RepID=A0A1I7EWK2_9PROT|nr:ceramidase domain-containing protein [Nitrosomonas eutropha]SFU28287.1 Ceramidase [Nitrosomonas eutropha]
MPTVDIPQHLAHKKRLIFIIVIAIVSAMGVFTQEAIPQDPHYNNFADTRYFLGIPNFYNVASSVAFVLVGVTGLVMLRSSKSQGVLQALRPGYTVFFIATMFIGLGSAYYHLEPNNATLVWDRLPMAAAFMAFFCIIVGEHISEHYGRTLLIPLLLLGSVSVFYWYFTELYGRGDLRLYVLIQYLPVVLVPLIMLLFPSRLKPSMFMWAPLAAYVLAKIFELDDMPVYDAVGISGHTLKHLISCIGILFVAVAICVRVPRVSPDCLPPSFPPDVNS